MSRRKSGEICFEIVGDMAMFATPVSKLSCECKSYPFPTYSSIVGMLKKIYSREELIWVPDACRVMNPIQYVCMTKVTPCYLGKKKQRFIYSYLEDVRYQIKAHYEMNDYYIMKKPLRFCYDETVRNIIADGCNNIVSLGKRECVGFVHPCTWGEGIGYYDNSGESEDEYMFHHFEYKYPVNSKISYAAFTMQRMKDGIIDFTPGNAPVVSRKWDFTCYQHYLKNMEDH